MGESATGIRWGEAGMLLSTLQHTGQMPTTKADPAKMSIVLRLGSPAPPPPRLPALTLRGQGGLVTLPDLVYHFTLRDL